jgi:putative peptide zinc metalloprotease protein
MTTGRYTADVAVAVYPFTRQIDGEEIVIGRADTAVFLALPPDAVEILDQLADGKTVGQVQQFYQAKYGETPDLEDFLVLLEQKGLVTAQGASHSPGALAAGTPAASVPAQTAAPVRFHFANFPLPLAQALYSRPMLLAAGLIILLGLATVVIEPALMPGWDALLFTEHLTLMSVSLEVLTCIMIFLHEMAHLVAARSVGVSSRLGISHRLWILVAETDMTGVWGVPKHQRYLPFLAGPLLDAVSACLIIFVTFAATRGWISLSAGGLHFAQAVLLVYLLRLLWQCFFFLRTDFYYVIANFFKCKNLMQDTQVFLLNQLRRLTGSGAITDQSHIPAAEMHAIHGYAVVWVVGRILAFATLFFITVPLVYSYILIVGAALGRGYTADPYGFIDALVMAAIFFVPLTAGFWLWIRSLLKQKGKPHATVS